MNHSAEIRALKARLSQLEAEAVREAPQPVKPSPVQIDSIPRDFAGRPIAPEIEDYETRQIKRVQADEAAFQARDAAMRKGLPAGFFRDPTGLIRNREGKVAQIIEMNGRLYNSDGTPFEGERQNADVAAVGRAQRRQHQAWLREQGLPVRTPEDD